MQVCELRKVLVILIVVLCLMPMGAMATLTCDTVYTYDDLESAILSGRSGCTISAGSVVNSTLNATNVTYFDRNFQLTFDAGDGSSVRVNNTLQFNGTTSSVGMTFTNTPNFTWPGTNLGFFANNSLIDFIGTQSITSISTSTLNMRAFTGTGLNVSGTGNTIGKWNITGDGPFGMNVSGSGNTIQTYTLNATQRGINLVGTGNTLTFSSLNTTASLGKFYIHNSATGNTIYDIDWTTTNKPSVYIYNGTAVQPGSTNVTKSAWYFYNSSWSKGPNNWGPNMNVTINVSSLIPISGNVGIRANFTNVTYTTSAVAVNITNSSLAVSNTGYSGGFIFNSTEQTIFRNLSAMVPVNITFGNNNFGSSYQELNIGTVYVLNFNPVNSTSPSVGKFNVTGTTNWSTIADFTNAKNVTFVVDSGSPSYTLYGNLSFIDPLNLTDPDTGTQLLRLGNALSMATAGNSIGLDITSGSGIPALDKAAMLQVYPNPTTAFAFTAGSTDIQVKADGTQIYNQNSWSRGNYVSSTAQLTVGNGNITLPVLHFTTYTFGAGVSPSSGGVAVSGGSGGLSAAPVTTQWATTVVETPTPGIPTTIGVNVGGSSAITKVAVTGTGVNDVIVTALPHTDLIASITKPATTVYQFVTVSPARYTTISSATFNFDIPTSWLAEKGYTKNDIVLTVWDTDTKAWTTLPTSIISEKNGIITYQAITPHMSEFAIIYQKGVSAQAQANVTAIQTSVPLTTTTATVTTVPITRTATPTPTKTVAPVPTAPPTGGLPTTTIIIAIVALIIIVAGAFLVHRWWVRRQNPALFKDLE